MLQSIVAKIRNLIEGDPGVRKVADDPVLSAELLLLFRMILADGSVSESEMQVFRRICHEAFGIGDESIDLVIEHLNEIGYETTGVQALAMFKELDFERRKQLARHMAEIAKADAQLAEPEMRVLKRTLDLLGVSAADIAANSELR
jgi:uncharacterized tellurite resistance protein B-like protein